MYNIRRVKHTKSQYLQATERQNKQIIQGKKIHLKKQEAKVVRPRLSK